jgi:hypothetical protein
MSGVVATPLAAGPGSEMPLVSRVAIGFTVGLCAAGCAALRETEIDPAVREKLGQGPPIHVVHVVPKPLGLNSRAGALGATEVVEEERDYYLTPGVEDPVADVERAFLDALREELGLSNLYPSDRPLWIQEKMATRGVTWEGASAYGDPMFAFPSEWFVRDELLLEFETLYWVLAAEPHFPGTPAKFTLILNLKARLVRLSDGTILWRVFCRSTQGPRFRPEFFADDWQLVKDLRPVLAKECAAELMGTFMGRTERSSWDGRHYPRKASR